MDLGFWAIAKQEPEYLALVSPDGGHYKAGQLLARANQVSNALRAQGLSAGDAVATLLPNCAEVFEIYLGALQVGIYLVPINHHLVAPEVAYIIEDSEAKMFIGHERFADLCGASATQAGLAPNQCLEVGKSHKIAGFQSYDEIVSASSSMDPDGRTIGDVMNYTSGTTGKPKGVRRPLTGQSPEDAALGLSGILFLFGIQPREDNVHIVGSPLYHTAVLRFSGASIHFGHTIVVMDKWTPEGMLDLIQRYKVTTSHMVPTQFHRLLNLDESVRKSYDVSSLRHMIHAAAPCPVDVKHKMIEWWGPSIDEYYAASEGGGTVVNTQEWLSKPGTVGKPWPISEIAIFDDQNERIDEPGKIGTVYMAMSSGDFEYHKDKDKTKSNRIGKFFTVGDIGYLDEDGYLFLCDRKTDMIISGGANIYPAEIEGVMMAHKAIADVAVFGIPNEDWGEEVKAVVELNPGIAPSLETADDIIAYCSDKLAKFKTPKSIDFIEEMPRDPNGKLYKRKLRDPYWEGKQRAI